MGTSRLHWFVAGMLAFLIGAASGSIVGRIVKPVLPVVTVEHVAAKPAQIVPSLTGISITAHVVSVHDGDTATVETTVQAHVRLLNCWAKELSQPGGPEARDALVKLIEGKACILHVPFDGLSTIGDATTLGRVLGYIEVDGQDASEWMVANKFAAKTKKDEQNLH